MNTTSDGIAITNRFFQAIEMLRLGGYLRGLKTFTDKHNLNRWNMVTLRDAPASSYLQPEWIAWLSKDYNISLEWIMFGTGEFFNFGIPPKTNTKNKPRKKQSEL